MGLSPCSTAASPILSRTVLRDTRWSGEAAWPPASTSLRVRLMVSGEESARPSSAEDQAREVFTERERDLERALSSSSVERKEELLSRVLREEPEVSDFWHRFEDTEGEVDTETATLAMLQISAPLSSSGLTVKNNKTVLLVITYQDI